MYNVHEPLRVHIYIYIGIYCVSKPRAILIYNIPTVIYSHVVIIQSYTPFIIRHVKYSISNNAMITIRSCISIIIDNNRFKINVIDTSNSKSIVTDSRFIDSFPYRMSLFILYRLVNGKRT
jgi:hypothetical protein